MMFVVWRTGYRTKPRMRPVKDVHKARQLAEEKRGMVYQPALRKNISSGEDCLS